MQLGISDSDIKFNESLYGDNTFVFELCDFDGLENEENENTFLNDEWKNCPDCNVHMNPMENTYICTLCGRTQEVFINNECVNSSSFDNCRTNDLSPTSFKIVGKNSYFYNKAVLQSTTEYSKTQYQTTKHYLNQCNDQRNIEYTTEFKKGKFPKNVLIAAAELYNIIQSNKIVRRGYGRKGTLGACLYFEFIRNGITKKPREIAKFLAIEEFHLSKGDKLLRRLHAEGLIDIPIHHSPVDSYLIQYFESLGIDTKYIPYISDIIDKATNGEMIGENSSKLSTQCVGSIWLLKMQLNLKITRTTISKICDITKPTYEKYYNYLLRNYNILNEICERHDIPLISSIKFRIPKKKKC